MDGPVSLYYMRLSWLSALCCCPVTSKRNETMASMCPAVVATCWNTSLSTPSWPRLGVWTPDIQDSFVDMSYPSGHTPALVIPALSSGQSLDPVLKANCRSAQFLSPSNSSFSSWLLPPPPPSPSHSPDIISCTQSAHNGIISITFGATVKSITVVPWSSSLLGSGTCDNCWHWGVPDCSQATYHETDTLTSVSSQERDTNWWASTEC